MPPSTDAAEAPAAALSMGAALRLGAIAGLLTHLPWLALSRVEVLQPLAVGMQAAFLVLDPWLTVPLYLRLRRAPRVAGPDLRFGLIAGLIAGTVAAITTVVWERFRTSAWLSAGELAAHLVEPMLAAFFALPTVLLARRLGANEAAR